MNASCAAIIPTYDRPDQLYFALKSIKLQKLTPNEIIVVDNHPDSKNKIVVKRICKKLKIKIKYLIFKKTGGALAARNYASNNTNCKYLAFLDDDDEWKKNYIYHSIKKIKKDNADICIAEYKVIDKIKKFSYDFHIPEKITFNDLIIWNPGILCSNILIKKNIFHELGGYDIKLFGSADKDLLIKIIDYKYKYTILKNRLINRLIHNYQWSNDNYLTFKASYALYKKYYNRMNLWLKMKMIKKFSIFFFKNFFNKIFINHLKT